MAEAEAEVVCVVEVVEEEDRLYEKYNWVLNIYMVPTIDNIQYPIFNIGIGRLGANTCYC